MSTRFDAASNLQFQRELWPRSIVPTLCDYIRIPNQSPAFEPDWAARGHSERAAQLLLTWIERLGLPGLSAEIVRPPGRTPSLWIEVEGASEEPVLLYGHFDKQPESSGWHAGLGPYEPVLRERRLYGRGSADDGYALFSALGAIASLRAQGVPHPRCVILIEGSEESGSPDLSATLETIGGRLGRPSLVVCLDAEAGDSSRLWCTTSLRGYLNARLEVRVLRAGAHSGSASGIVPSAFAVASRLLARLEDPATDRLALAARDGEVPSEVRTQARDTAALLGERIVQKFGFLPGVRPLRAELSELVLDNTWRPTLSVTGADGLPPCNEAGNVLLPALTLKLSFRLCPIADYAQAAHEIERVLLEEAPYGAHVRFDVEAGARGWRAAPLPAWLREAVASASKNAFGHAPAYWGEGGSIPFIGMLGERFPEASFVVTGALGPESNAHGPNEFLDLELAERVTSAVAEILAAHVSAAG
jgi:acetylornithine deacetylase/succinyl-diaminopimelate desuccinylase-like protein